MYFLLLLFTLTCDCTRVCCKGEEAVTQKNGRMERIFLTEFSQTNKQTKMESVVVVARIGVWGASFGRRDECLMKIITLMMMMMRLGIEQ